MLTDDGHTEAVPAKAWLTGEADVAFFLGATNFARARMMHVDTYKGRVVLRRDAVERLILAHSARSMQSRSNRPSTPFGFPT